MRDSNFLSSVFHSETSFKVLWISLFIYLIAIVISLVLSSVFYWFSFGDAANNRGIVDERSLFDMILIISEFLMLRFLLGQHKAKEYGNSKIFLSLAIANVILLILIH